MKRFFLAALLFTSAIPAHAQLDAPLPPRVAAMKMTLPAGFKATLFAGEPDVVQPIAFCFDDRGRLWVAECLSYPNWDGDPKKGKDRIVIFEEGDNGAFSKRTVFANNIQNISGINYGFGGIWVCATPNLLFIPIKDGDKPGEPEIVLDGWSLKAGHNVFNSLTWGPDGWLYGCNGIVATSYVGRPGTPKKDRVPINCGVWRYHPTKKKFEAVAHGTTNPWGLDFDEHGEMFITNCVIDHLWHIVPGGHYERMYGEDLNPHVYKLMPSICDHKHWGGGSWTSSRAPSNGEPSSVRSRVEDYKVHSAAGGGHAHVGCMIYLGDNWPARYRGGVFMCNLHGNRINHDILERNGSTYVARHAKDFMHANDPWFRGLAIHYGPDGGVYVSDWTDTGECHNYKVVDRTNGRIFKITYGDVKPWKGDLAKLSDVELAKLQASKNEWMVRHARRLLQERAVNKRIAVDAAELLQKTLEKSTDVNARLRSLWALHVTEELYTPDLFNMVYREAKNRTWLPNSEHFRAWTIRLMAHEGVTQAMNTLVDSKNGWLIPEFHKLVQSEESPLVRLHLASSAQRIPMNARVILASILGQRPEDANDTFLPLMYWYALEPTLLNRPEPDTIFSAHRISLIRTYTGRRVTELGVADHLIGTSLFSKMLEAMIKRDQAAYHRDLLRGIQEGLAGQRQVKMPKKWTDAYPILIESPLPEVRERALALAVQFGDERAFKLLRDIALNELHPLKERESALQTLIFQQKPDLPTILGPLLLDKEMRRPAIRGMAAFDSAEAANYMVQNYRGWDVDTRNDAMQTLSARPKYALVLLDAVEQKWIPRADINSITIRQLQALKSKEVADKLTKAIGEIRPASADKAKLMAKYKADLKPDVLKKANLANGRALYNKACATCHRLFGEGGDIGPDLTGSQRTNLDYILENVLDPSAIVPREYQVTVVETKKGRTLSGIVKKESDAAVTLQTQNEQVVIPKADIESRVETKVSMMPEGIFEGLRIEEVRDLVGYLASPSQVPLKK